MVNDNVLLQPTKHRFLFTRCERALGWLLGWLLGWFLLAHDECGLVRSERDNAGRLFPGFTVALGRHEPRLYHDLRERDAGQ